MKCLFERLDENAIQCINCKTIIKTKMDTKMCFAICKNGGLISNIIDTSKQVVSEIKKFVENPTIVSQEEQNKRLEICKTCEYFKNNRCDLCGCYMNLKSKLETSHCPINKW